VVNTNTAVTTITHTGDGTTNIMSGGVVTLALTYTGAAPFTYP